MSIRSEKENITPRYEKRIVFVRENEVITERFSPEDLKRDKVRVRHQYSLISAGTEILSLTGVMGRVIRGTPGYSSVGIVEEINGNSKFAVGDRVFSGGQHTSLYDIEISAAEKGFVKTDMADLKLATFINLGKVALHGIRKTGVGAGDNVVVFGLGVVGNLSAQIARSCSVGSVVGVDIDEYRLKIASELGIKVIDGRDNGLADKIVKITEGGADVIIEASGSKDVIPSIFKIARYNARIGIVAGLYGLTTLDLKSEFQNKELTMIGCRRVDFTNEKNNYDRWPIRTMFNAFINMVNREEINVKKLISHIVVPDEVPSIYMDLKNKKGNYLGVIIEWGK